MALLQYDIKVVGAQNIDRAFAGIERRLQEHNRRVTQMSGMTPADAKRASSPGGIGQARARAANQNGSALAAARQIASEERKVVADKRRALAEEVRTKNQLNNLNVREYNKEIRAKAAAAQRDQRVTERTARGRSQFVQSTLGHGVDRVTGTVKAVGTAGAAMLGIGGAGLAASAVAGATRLDEQTRRIIIGARGGGESSKYDPTQLRRQFENTGIETGMGPEAIAGGVQKFVSKTGDIDTAVKNMKTFATVAQATGASVEDIASASADLSEKMDIKSVDDMQQALATLTFQGKKGAFELKDMAQYLPEISAAAATFGIKGVGGITQLGGMMQVARQATGSGAEASTSLEAMFKQMVAKSGDIQSGDAFSGNKVSIFQGNDPTKPLRDFNEILGDMIEASRGNLQQLGQTFDVRGIRAVNPLIAEYRKASEAAGGGDKGSKAGRAAVMAKLHDASNVKGDFGEVQADAKAAMKSFTVQMDIIDTQLKQAMADQLLPEIVKLAPEFAKLVPYVGQATKMFVELVKFFLDHPFASVALVVGAQLAADFAAARLGSVAKGALEKAMAAGTARFGGGAAETGASPGLMGKPSFAGAMGAAATGAALGLAVGTAIITANVANFEMGEASMKSSGQALNQIRAMTSPDQAGDARKLVEDQRAKVNELKKPGLIESIAGNGFAQMVGAAPSDTEVKTQTSFLGEMEAQLQKLELLRDAAKKIEAAGVSGEEAAKQLNEAAKRFGLNTPNRSNVPSPIKS